MVRRSLFILGAFLLVGAQGTSPGELESNRLLLDRIRKDPEVYGQMCQDLRVFNRLSPERKEELRQLDRDLQKETSASQARLVRAAERYQQWLERLTPDERRAVEQSPDKKQRLAAIKKIRQKQWIERLPKAAREHLQKAQGTVREEALKDYHRLEKRRQLGWKLALGQWDDLSRKGPEDRLDKFPKEVQEFVTQALLPRLSDEQKEQLRRAEGYWPLYPRTLVELADKSAFRLLLPPAGPSKLEDLPEDFQKRLRHLRPWDQGKKRPFLLAVRPPDKWPEFGIFVSETARKHNIPLPHQLGPCAPDEFPAPTKEYIKQTMMNWKNSVLERKEWEYLRGNEGNWPAYPQALFALIRKYNLQVPGVSLPGSPELWDRYRDHPLAPTAEPSVVSDRTLRHFERWELTPEERAKLSGPANRERLQQEYSKRHPEEWEKLQESDREKQAARKSAEGSK